MKKGQLQRLPKDGLNYIVLLYSLLACVSLGIFGALHLFEQHTILGLLEIAGSLIFFGNMLLLWATDNVRLTKNIFLWTVLAFLVVMLITGGTAKTGVFWYFVFPVAAFFLSGKRQGMVWMAVLFIASFIPWLLSIYGFIPIAYDTATVRQLLISVLVVGLGIYVYQWWRERLEYQTSESRHELNTEKVRADVIVQNIDEGIVVTDTEGKVTFINQAAERILGWRSTDLIGKKFVDEVPLIDNSGNIVPIANRPLQRSLEAAESISAVATYRRKDGQVLPVSVTGMPVKVEGKMTGAIGTFRDISEEQQIARTKSEFVTLASHQLRTPISAIAWLSELLLHGDAGKLSHEVHEHIEDIYHSNQRMASLVSEMLIVSSLELESLPVQPQATDLEKLTKRIFDQQRSLHPQATANIRQTYASDLPQLQCDPEIITLILRNLISNALKYTPASGNIKLSITTDTGTKLTRQSHGSVVITVQDTGYGIPRSAITKVFTKFFRAANIVHKDTDGTGLGLYIVKALLDYVGGSISFSSHEGKGTTFTVHLPLEGMIAHNPDGTSLSKTTRKSLLKNNEAVHV